MRCVILIGVPGVGKTTVTRNMLTRLRGPVTDVRYKTIYGKYYQEDSLFVLGDYDSDHVFGGTDRFSMGIQRDAEVFWMAVHRSFPEETVIFGEGARVANRAFITMAQNYCEINLIYLYASQEICAERRGARGKQEHSWVKGMQTKVRKLCEMYQVYARLNETPSDLETNSTFLHTFLTRGAHEAVS